MKRVKITECGENTDRGKEYFVELIETLVFDSKSDAIRWAKEQGVQDSSIFLKQKENNDE